MNAPAPAQAQSHPTVGDADTPINPYVMQQINELHNRINIQNQTMQGMWTRLQPLTKFHDWVKETHPELLSQYVSIRQLEELGKTVVPEMRGYAQAIPKASGQPVNYDNGTI